MAVAEFEWGDVVGLVLAGLAAVLFWIAIQGYRRRPTTRVLLFASVFGVFFAKGILKVLGVFVVGEGAVVDGLELIADGAISCCSSRAWSRRDRSPGPGHPPQALPSHRRRPRPLPA